MDITSTSDNDTPRRNRVRTWSAVAAASVALGVSAIALSALPSGATDRTTHAVPASTSAGESVVNMTPGDSTTVQGTPDGDSVSQGDDTKPADPIATTKPATPIPDPNGESVVNMTPGDSTTVQGTPDGDSVSQGDDTKPAGQLGATTADTEGESVINMTPGDSTTVQGTPNGDTVSGAAAGR